DGVALEIAQDGSAEDGGDDDDPEKRAADIVIDIGIGAVQQHLAVRVADGSEALAGNIQKAEGEPDGEIDVRRNAVKAKLQLELEELEEHGHIVVPLVLRLLREVQEV